MKTWILTTEYNEYDQYGEYFVAWFKDKPSLEWLCEIFGQKLALHLLEGGGRQGTEDQWYNLRKVEEGHEL